ncbi:NUDIX hydrolase [Thiohalobacter sp. IOR34]|uniref:NUDIX hydrolase n=1 Tax=Thiohalobacter sp. IOR34 TaxID=3057176 RepID=UPI0025B0EFB9|nr:NUDIX hydrolase [Thiohalobacter sp. IOR34]WJW76017.1 NUDIX hydrolase [Thiohalobacter sp. IOR34]
MAGQRRIIHQGRVVDLGIEAVRLPDGSELELEVVRHPGGAAVVAVDAHGRICLLRQYRHAAGGWLWELPAGKLDPREAPATAARRELEEEAGVRAADWQSLGQILTTPGFCDERIHLYLARDLTPVGQRLEAHECLEVHWLERAEIERRLENDELSDAKTLIGLYRALPRL